jgi:hypothetical protein
VTVVSLTPARAVAASSATYEVTGAPLYRTPDGALIAPTDLTVRVIDGRAELDLAGLQIDPRILDPSQPRNRIECRMPIDRAPTWATAITTEQAWRAITAILAGAIPPELGYDPESGFPARRDDHGDVRGDGRGRWRWICYQPGPALTAAQVADLVSYLPAHGELVDLPLLAVDPVTGLAAIRTADRWWWLRYTAAAPLSPAQAADLVLYQAATVTAGAGGAR